MVCSVLAISFQKEAGVGSAPTQDWQTLKYRFCHLLHKMNVMWILSTYSMLDVIHHFTEYDFIQRLTVMASGDQCNYQSLCGPGAA